jgi:phosphoribosylanthranilate isomerase
MITGVILKICGITNQDDAWAAIDGGANAIGFNFYRRSPRYIAPELAAEITSSGVQRVGVFVNESPAHVEAVAARAGLHVAQLHGDERPSDYPASIAVWKAARVGAEFDARDYRGIPAEALLLDGPAGELYGGAGQAFDWQIAAVSELRIILAGGLDAANVARAVALAHPWGVDACSRIESAPGKKDHKKMNEFLQAARAALTV